MEEIFVKERTLPEAYHEALTQLWYFGDEASCSDWNTKQIEASATIVVEEPLAEPMISRCFFGTPQSLEQYRQEMLDGILDFEVERGKWTYTYHLRYADQYQFIVDELSRNPDSRRAVMDVRRLEDMGIDDPACLQSIQFFIRDGKLHMKVLFRSNDACKASFSNMFALIMLQKRVADDLGIEVGTYTHRANSYHCYERDYDMLRGYVDRICSSDNSALTYNYIGEWDEMMDDAKRSIADMVEDLKTR